VSYGSAHPSGFGAQGFAGCSEERVIRLQYPNAIAPRRRLIEGALVQDGTYFVFRQDAEFSSLSAVEQPWRMAASDGPFVVENKRRQDVEQLEAV
jgi:hypothetical protein